VGILIKCNVEFTVRVKNVHCKDNRVGVLIEESMGLSIVLPRFLSESRSITCDPGCPVAVGNLGLINLEYINYMIDKAIPAGVAFVDREHGLLRVETTRGVRDVTVVQLGHRRAQVNRVHHGPRLWRSTGQTRQPAAHLGK